MPLWRDEGPSEEGHPPDYDLRDAELVLSEEGRQPVRPHLR